MLSNWLVFNVFPRLAYIYVNFQLNYALFENIGIIYWLGTLFHTFKYNRIVKLYTNRLNGEVLFVSAPERQIVSGCLESGMEINQTRNWLAQFIRDSDRFLTPWWKEILSDVFWSIGCSSLIFLALYQSSKGSIY